MPSLSSIKQQAAANESLAVGASIMAVGNTAARPDPAATGQFRMNSEIGKPEWYNANIGNWEKFSPIPPFDIEYLVVAGGGGGGAFGGGGGAGGMQTDIMRDVNEGSSFIITVGAGGTATPENFDAVGGRGGNSAFGTIISIGGGGGGTRLLRTNIDGGSGGGAGFDQFGGTTPAGGAGISGQGRNGGAGGNSPSPFPSGSGGGAGGVGGAAYSSGAFGTGGGIGLQSSITGTAIYYAGGGGGGTIPFQGGGGAPGGLGGGGGGGSAGSAGSASTGGGGGGSAFIGGSGVVILKTPATAVSTTGSPAITRDGSFNIYRFTGSGSIAF